MIPEYLRNTRIQLAILFGTLALALITMHLFRGTGLESLYMLFGALVAVEIFVFVGLEVKQGAQKHGWKHEIVDTFIALLVAVGVWFALSFILNSPTPISGVVSCSMLHNLERGDFIIVQGAESEGYDITMTKAELDSITGRAIISYNGNEASIDGSLFSFCVANRNTAICDAFVKTPEQFTETKGPLTYKYQRCELSFSNGSSAYQPCLVSVIYKGTEYKTNLSHDIIVYQPQPGDLYSSVGDIVHRIFFKINAEGETYYLTRGDNNPLLDVQVYDYGAAAGNRPVPENRVRGKVIGRIPLLGYFKLFISGYFQEDAQCRTHLLFPTAE
ncbi:hypothetical protein JXA56_04170 [Candidatus Micrarchaeota archaeon]|nr:hypothetical protein [Candidatus Micrarchaeota archaeon]